MVLHVNHLTKDRHRTLAEAWSSSEYPLDDRASLQELVLEIDVRVRDPGPIIAKMPLPRVGTQ